MWRYGRRAECGVRRDIDLAAQKNGASREGIIVIEPHLAPAGSRRSAGANHRQRDRRRSIVGNNRREVKCIRIPLADGSVIPDDQVAAITRSKSTASNRLSVSRRGSHQNHAALDDGGSRAQKSNRARAGALIETKCVDRIRAGGEVAPGDIKRRIAGPGGVVGRRGQRSGCRRDEIVASERRSDQDRLRRSRDRAAARRRWGVGELRVEPGGGRHHQHTVAVADETCAASPGDGEIRRAGRAIGAEVVEAAV